MSAHDISRPSEIRDHWFKRAEQLEKKGFEVQRLKDMTSNDVDKRRWQQSEDSFFQEADAYKKMAGAIVAQMKSITSGEPLNRERANLAIFEFAHGDFENARQVLDETMSRFEALLMPDTSSALVEKVHRVIARMRNDPRTFHFVRLNAPDLIVRPEVANSGNSMDGLNWPEELRSLVWDAQRALIRYVDALDNLKRSYATITDAERQEFSWVFP